MEAQMWNLTEEFYCLRMMGQVWCWAFALPGTSWWQRKRSHTGFSTELRNVGSFIQALSNGHILPCPKRRGQVLAW